MVTSIREWNHRGGSPLHHARNVQALQELIDSVGAPCWASGPTAAALHGFDGFRLEPPFHVVVPHDRSVSRLGHVVHRYRDLVRLDLSEIDGVPTISATRTIIDLAATETLNGSPLRSIAHCATGRRARTSCTVASSSCGVGAEGAWPGLSRYWKAPSTGAAAIRGWSDDFRPCSPAPDYLHR